MILFRLKDVFRIIVTALNKGNDENQKISIETKIKKVHIKFTNFFLNSLGGCLYIFGIYAVIEELINLNKETFGLVNYGFAIMLGLSSICFSWARNLGREEINKIKFLNKIGIDALYGSIVFLVGSSLKYFAFGIESKIGTREYISWVVYIPKIFVIICFLFAVIKFYNVIADLFRIIAIAKDEEWTENLDARKEIKD